MAPRTDIEHDYRSISSGSTTSPTMPAPKPDGSPLQPTKTPEQVYPSNKTVIPIMAGIFLAAFLVSLDRLIIATAIPSITDHFHSLNDVGWYASAYMLPMAACMLPMGRVYTFYSPKWVFLANITVFELGSLICGLASSSVMLIVGRAIAGLGSSGIMSGAITIIVHILPLHKRPAWTGFMGVVFGVSSILGPLLGGIFTDKISWRWCFYINLPFGGVTIALLLFFLKLDFEPPQKLNWKDQVIRLDPIGVCLLVPSIVCLLLALQNGGTEWAWSSWRIILLMTLFAILIVAFIGVQLWRRDTATVPPRIMTCRSVVAGLFYSTCNGAGMMTMVYYIPIWFQAIHGASAERSGILMLPMVLGIVATSITAGILTKKIGYYTPWMYISAIIVPIAAGLISTFSTNTGESKWIGYQLLYGLGLGLGMQQPSVAAQTVLPKKDVPTGASLMFFGQNLGGSIFVSVANNLFINKLASGLVKANVPGITPTVVANTGATDLRKVVPAAVLPQVLQIYNIAIRQAFYVGVAVSAALIFSAVFMEWKSVKQQTAQKSKTAEVDSEKQ